MVVPVLGFGSLGALLMSPSGVLFFAQLLICSISSVLKMRSCAYRRYFGSAGHGGIVLFCVDAAMLLA